MCVFTFHSSPLMMYIVDGTDQPVSTWEYLSWSMRFEFVCLSKYIVLTCPTKDCTILGKYLDWLQSLKQSFIILVASLTLMALFKTEPSELDLLQV